MEGTQLNIGLAPVAIDFFTSLPGLKFSGAWDVKEISKSGEIDVYYLSLPDLLTAKKIAERQVDLADIEELTRFREGR